VLDLKLVFQVFHLFIRFLGILPSLLNFEGHFHFADLELLILGLDIVKTKDECRVLGGNILDNCFVEFKFFLVQTLSLLHLLQL